MTDREDDPEYPSQINAATDKDCAEDPDKAPAAFAGCIDGDKVRIDVVIAGHSHVIRTWFSPEKAKVFGEGLIKAHDIIKGLTADPLAGKAN